MKNIIQTVFNSYSKLYFLLNEIISVDTFFIYKFYFKILPIIDVYFKTTYNHRIIILKVFTRIIYRNFFPIFLYFKYLI